MHNKKFPAVVVSSEHPRWKAGDKVVLNGWGVGEKHWGGLAGQARVSGDWLVPLPEGIDFRQAMAIGTAGYTAMLCVIALERQGVRPEDGEVLVTGASGGVGSIAITLLAKLGYTVTAVTGRSSEEAYLKQLGATNILPRVEFTQAGRPLAKERWAGAIDSVGSTVLANVLASVKYGGAVAAVGLAGGMDLPATVATVLTSVVATTVSLTVALAHGDSRSQGTAPAPAPSSSVVKAAIPTISTTQSLTSGSVPKMSIGKSTAATSPRLTCKTARTMTSLCLASHSLPAIKSTRSPTQDQTPCVK